MGSMKEAQDIWDNLNPEDFKPKSSGGDSGESSKRREVAALENGDYAVRVLFFNYWVTEKGQTFYKWGLEVDDGLMKGGFVEKFQAATDVGLKILAQDMMLMLGNLPPMDEIYNPEQNRAGNIQADVIGKRLKMRKSVNRNGYDQFYFNEVLSNDVVADDDEIPF